MLSKLQDYMQKLLSLSTLRVNFVTLGINRFPRRYNLADDVDPSYFTLGEITDENDGRYVNHVAQIVQTNTVKSELPSSPNGFYTGLNGFIGSSECTVPGLIGVLQDMGYRHIMMVTQEGLTNQHGGRGSLSGVQPRGVILDPFINMPGRGHRKFYHGIDWENFPMADCDLDESEEVNKKEFLESHGFLGVYEQGLLVAKQNERRIVRVRDFFDAKLHDTIYATNDDASKVVLVGLNPNVYPPDSDNMRPHSLDHDAMCGYNTHVSKFEPITGHHLIGVCGSVPHEEKIQALQDVLKGFSARGYYADPSVALSKRLKKSA